MKTKEIKEQKLPDWFHGSLYKEGATVQNPFSGECYTLTNVELSMYDFVWGCSCVPNLSKEMVKNWRKGLDWFMKNNPKAYIVLLD